MIDWPQTVALAVLQGLTEFLPISSSAHLILLPVMLGIEDQGLAFDVSVHVGSLAAVILYFKTDLLLLTRAWLKSVASGTGTPESRLAWSVVIATIPIVAAGLVLNRYADQLRDPLIIATATLVFALLLWWADSRKTEQRDELQMGWREAVAVGCAQVLALIPGTSRSGVTMTAALAMGFSRTAAARFSFLLSIPVILAAGTLKTYELAHGVHQIPWTLLLSGMLLSGLTAYLCIHWFLRFVERVGMLPFVIYRIVLAAVLFAVFL